MIEGSGSKDFAKVKTWAYRHPESFGLLIDLLVDAVVDHLAYQVEAGVDAVQLFDSWAGVLPEEQLFHWSLEPMVRIAKGVRERHPKMPIIAFPRAVGPATLMYRRPDTFSALSIDTGIGAHWAAKELQPHICLQGNLDPIMLVAGGAGDGARGDAHPRQARPRPLRVQSRPRRGAADAARQCRAPGRDRAQLEAGRS